MLCYYIHNTFFFYCFVVLKTFNVFAPSVGVTILLLRTAKAINNKTNVFVSECGSDKWPIDTFHILSHIHFLFLFSHFIVLSLCLWHSFLIMFSYLSGTAYLQRCNSTAFVLGLGKEHILAVHAQIKGPWPFERSMIL